MSAAGKMSGPLDASPGRGRARLALGALLVIAAIVASYWPALRGGMLWDDDAHVTRPELRTLEGLGRIWFEVGAAQQYYPLLHTAFWVEHRLWGDWTPGYHAVNLALHALAAVLVMLIVRRLLRERGAAWADGAAWLTGAVWALHPVNVESVAWISEQKNTLSAVFYLSSMLAYLEFDRTRGRGVYALAAALFVCGLLTKTVTATLPAALLVIFWWRRGSLSWRRDVVPLLAWFALGAASGLFTAYVEKNIIGAKGRGFELPLAERLLLGGRVVWFYLGKVFWPREFIFVYPRWTVSAGVWWQWLFPAGALALAGAAWAVRRRSRAVLAGLLFFVGTLFPVLGLFNVYPFLFSFVADHFQYLAGLGVIAVACGGVAVAASRVRAGAARATVLGAVPAVLAVLTHAQARTYRDVETLYRTTIERNPSCWMAHNNLGVVLRDRGDVEGAMGHYRRALELRPEYPEARNNMGIVLAAAGRYGEAVDSYREALRLRENNPGALANLSAALTALGRHAEAVEAAELAVRYDPGDAGLHARRGGALKAAGRPAEAVKALERSLSLNPEQPGVRAQLEVLTAGARPPAEAAAVLERVVAAEPGNFEARFALGVALADLGRTDAAAEQYAEVIRVRPDHAEARSNLGMVLAKAGRVADAIPHFEEAARLRPDAAPVRMNLAIAYASAGRLGEAIAAAERARDAARAAGQPETAAKIEEWIKACRERAGGGG